jgi:hypothetical protein
VPGQLQVAQVILVLEAKEKLVHSIEILSASRHDSSGWRALHRTLNRKRRRRQKKSFVFIRTTRVSYVLRLKLEHVSTGGKGRREICCFRMHNS